jgi:hypothetical protein
MEQCSHHTLKSTVAVFGFTIFVILVVNLSLGLFLESKDNGICVIRFVFAGVDSARQHEPPDRVSLCPLVLAAVINGK